MPATALRMQRQAAGPRRFGWGRETFGLRILIVRQD